MDGATAEAALVEAVSATGKSDDALSASDAVQLMVDFYRSTPSDPTVYEEDGDMLLYQWGVYDWGTGPSFEFDLVRQLIDSDGEMEQVHLTLHFDPMPELSVLGDGNRWCAAPDELDDFRDFVTESPAFGLVAELRPVRVELYSEAV